MHSLYGRIKANPSRMIRMSREAAELHIQSAEKTVGYKDGIGSLFAVGELRIRSMYAK